MGSNSSSQSRQLHAKSGYFGSSPMVGDDLDDQGIRRTIQQTQAEQLYKFQQQQALNRPKLKSVTSINNPWFHLFTLDKTFILSFGLTSQTPVTISLISQGVIISRSIDTTEKMIFNIPLPFLSDFILEITPDSASLEQFKKPDNSVVMQHKIYFILFQNDGFLDGSIEKEEYYTEDFSYVHELKKILPVETDELHDVCYFCLKNQPTVSLGQCSHLILCESCANSGQYHFDKCPLCKDSNV